MIAKENLKVKGKQKGKSIVKDFVIVVLIILTILLVGGGISWSKLSKGLREARSLPLNVVDFSNLNDGTIMGQMRAFSSCAKE